MDKALREFLADAKAVKLTPAEHVVGKDKLLQHIEGAHIASVAADAQEMQLSTAEKKMGKKDLKAFMKTNPVKKVVREGFFARFGRLFTLRLPAMAMVVVLLVSIGGGAAYGAESALPGDMLYPIKTEFTEPLRERFMRSPERRAHFAAWRIERRLHEAEKLLERAETQPELLDEIKVRIELHTQHLEERMESLESDEQAEHIRVRLENRIAKHEEILDSIDEGTFDPGQLKKFRKHIHGRRDRIRKMGPPGRRRGPPPAVFEQLKNESAEVRAIFEKYQNEDGTLPPPRQLRQQLTPEERQVIREEIQETLSSIEPPRRPDGLPADTRPTPQFRGQFRDPPREEPFRRPPLRINADVESSDTGVRQPPFRGPRPGVQRPGPRPGGGHRGPKRPQPIRTQGVENVESDTTSIR